MRAPRRHLLCSMTVLALALSLGSAGARADGAKLDGRLREKGTRKPLQDVNVYLIPQVPEGAPPPKPLKATTDAQGRFAIEGVEPGPYRWIVNLSGYDRLELPEEIRPEAPSSLELYLEKSSYLGVYETTIYDKAQKRDDKTRSIKASDLSKLAGAANDPVRAVQNLPGVNRPSGFSSQVVIEGSAPNDTAYQIEGQEVPLIFHFGAFSTVVPPESVDRVDLLTSGFGVEYGRTTAGLVSVWLKKPRNDRLHGVGYVDSFNLGAMIEGPAGEQGSFFLGLRYSYIGQALKLALSGNDAFDLTVAPDFSDLTGIYQTELTPIDTFKLVEIASLDQLNFIFKEPVTSNPALRGSFSNLTSFFRIIPELTHRHSPRTTSRLSFGFGKDWLRIDTGTNFLHVTDWTLTTRYDLEKQLTPYWKAAWGIDNSFYWTQTEFSLPKMYSAGGVPTPFSVAQVLAASVRQDYVALGAYWRNELRLGDSPWTLLPALRVETYNLTRETIPEPRLQLRYRLSDYLTLRSASGLYAMPPEPQQTSPVYGNPGIKMPLAAHLTAGAEADFRRGSSDGWELSGDLFYKHFYRVVIPSSALLPQAGGALAPENYNNNGRGRALGLELQAKYGYGALSGWLTYMLSRSTRWNPAAPESVAAFDQTHNLAALGSVQLGRNWQISSRFRFVSGNPYTPVASSVFDADSDVYIPIPGSYYSQRLEPFWQLDVRIDKKWIMDKWILSAYLDIQNVTNHANNEAIRYSYDYSQMTYVQNLPIIPILGVKGEF